MDTLRLGATVRAIRIRRGWRQADLASAAGVSRGTIWRIEHGRVGTMTLERLLSVVTALEIRLDLVPRWHGGELDRLLNAAHSAMHEQMAITFSALAGWLAAPEVSFSVYGERGVIDLLAYHPGRQSLLVIELKTDIVDIQQLVGAMDRYTRLAARVARDRGWRARSVSCWLIVRDTMTNRRRVAAHSAVLSAALPHDRQLVRRWLRDPVGEVRGLSFLSDAHPVSGRGPRRGVRRVRQPVRPGPTLSRRQQELGTALANPLTPSSASI